jgi:hypothetical protein
MKTNVVIVCWPESQDLMMYEGFEENCELINSERGLDLYGSSAFYVNKEWLQEIKKGNVKCRDDQDDIL